MRCRSSNTLWDRAIEMRWCDVGAFVSGVLAVACAVGVQKASFLP